MQKVGINNPKECWKFGYYVKDNVFWSNKKVEELPEYDMPTAFIYYVMSTLRFLDNNHWEVKTPKYKLFPKNPRIETKRVIEMFNNKKVDLA